MVVILNRLLLLERFWYWYWFIIPVISLYQYQCLGIFIHVFGDITVSISVFGGSSWSISHVWWIWYNSVIVLEIIIDYLDISISKAIDLGFLEVLKYPIFGSFLKWRYPIIHPYSRGLSIINHPFWGSPIQETTIWGYIFLGGYNFMIINSNT